MSKSLGLFPKKTRRNEVNPWNPISEFERDMERWFGANNYDFPLTSEVDGINFTPICDYEETNGKYVIRLDVPGIKKSDIKIEMDNNRLTVSGERRHEKEDKDARHCLLETSYGAFMRTLAFPKPVKEDAVDARYEDGVLTIRVPKAKAASSKLIKVH